MIQKDMSNKGKTNLFYKDVLKLQKSNCKLKNYLQSMTSKEWPKKFDMMFKELFIRSLSRSLLGKMWR